MDKLGTRETRSSGHMETIAVTLSQLRPLIYIYLFVCQQLAFISWSIELQTNFFIWNNYHDQSIELNKRCLYHDKSQFQYNINIDSRISEINKMG